MPSPTAEPVETPVAIAPSRDHGLGHANGNGRGRNGERHSPLSITTASIGNYALEAKLTSAKDALVLEKAQNNPSQNIPVTLPEESNDPRVKTLAKLLTSPQVKQFIYRGAVLPAFQPRFGPGSMRAPARLLQS